MLGFVILINRVDFVSSIHPLLWGAVAASLPLCFLLVDIFFSLDFIAAGEGIIATSSDGGVLKPPMNLMYMVVRVGRIMIRLGTFLLGVTDSYGRDQSCFQRLTPGAQRALEIGH